MIGGNGTLLMIKGIKLRYILWAFAIVFAIPLIWDARKKILRMIVFWCLILFAIWLGFCAFRGIRNGNDLTILRNDLMGYAGFAILPALVGLFTEKKIRIIENVLFFAGTAFGLGMLVITYLAVYPSMAGFFTWMKEYGISFTGGFLATNTLRVFYASSCFVLFSGVLGISLIPRSQKKLRWLYLLCVSICFAAIIITYTRSLYLALGSMSILNLVLILVFEKKQGIRALKSFLLSCVCALLILIILTVTQGSHPIYAAASRLLGLTISAEEIEEIEEKIISSTGKGTQSNKPKDSNKPKAQVSPELKQLEEVSADIRGRTIQEHVRIIKASPVIGHGLGVHIDFRAGGLSEYFYLDLWGKAGIAGLVLYMFSMFWCIWNMFRVRKEKPEAAWQIGAWICAVGTLFVVSLFNPYMSSSIGVSFYSALIAVTLVRTERGEH